MQIRHPTMGRKGKMLMVRGSENLVLPLIHIIIAMKILVGATK